MSDACIAAGCLGIAFYNSWQLTLVLMATIPVSVVALTFISRGLGKAVEAQKRQLGHASQLVTAAVTAIDLVKVYNGFDNEVWQYIQTVKVVSAHFLQQAWRNAMQIGWIMLWTVNLFVIGYWFAARLVANNQITAGSAITTFYCATTAFQAIENFGPQWLVMVKGIAAGHGLQNIVLDMAQSRRKTPDSKGLHQPARCIGDVELNDVSFAYPSNPDKLVLNRSSFFFPAGEMTFLVGRSGSGKSTLSNLILKIYDPHTGTIAIDGHPAETLADDWVRSNITLIQQSSILFDDSVFMNVAFGGDDPSRVTRDEVRAACDMALLQSTLAGLPDGLDTNVGMGGYNLSGGQKQRLALARARLRDPPVLILDEVTSGLDPVSRDLIMEAIRLWRTGKTTIIITHDVNQIKNEDYVYVMDKAYLVQEGFRKHVVKDEGGVFAALVHSTDEGAGESKSSLSTSDSSSSELSDSDSASDLGDLLTAGSRLSTHPFVARRLSVKTINRLSKILPRQSRGDASMSSGLFGTLGAGTSQSIVMRTQDTWNSTVTSPTATGRSDQLKGPSRPKLDRKASSFHKTTASRLSSLAVVQARGEMTRAHRPPNFSRIKIDRDAPQPGNYDRKGSVGTSIVGLTPEDESNNTHKIRHAEGARHGKKALSLTKILNTVWPVLSTKDRIRAICGLFACVISASANPAFSYVLSELVAVFWAPPAQMAADGQAWAIRLTIIAAVDGIALFTAHYFLQCVGQAWVTSLRVEALKRILSQPREFYDKQRHSPSRIVEVLDRNAEEMRNLVGRFVPIILIVAFMILITMVWALVVSWKLTLVALSAGPVVYAATRSGAEVSTNWEAKTNVAAAAAGSVTMETLLNIRVVRALTLESYFSRKHESAADDALRVGMTRAVWTGLFFGVNLAMYWWMTALVLYYALVLLTAPGSTSSVNSILQVINLVTFGMGTASTMLNNIPQLAQAKATAIQILYYATLSYQNSHEGHGEKRVLTPFPVEMRDLQFAYPAAKGSKDAPHKVLRNVNLSIDRGQCVAIVGSSGCGKSTIANLLLRLYEPLHGNDPEEQLHEPNLDNYPYRQLKGSTSHRRAPLSYAGVPADEISTSILRTHVASVPQHPFLFPTTIHENIAYGLHPDSPYRSPGAVEAAAKLACLHDFITSLPDGYNTVVGEGGVGLSGGQAQRLSIARALVRRPKLLVMDEPTSALDADGAEGVRIAVKGLIEASRTSAEKMTVVVVTHSKEMMRMAERIVVMDLGFVAEEGGYEELLARRGKFAELVGCGAWMSSAGAKGKGKAKAKANGSEKARKEPRSGSNQQAEEGFMDEDDIWWGRDSNDIDSSSVLEDPFASTESISTARQDALQKLEGPPREVQIRKGWGG